MNLPNKSVLIQPSQVLSVWAIRKDSGLALLRVAVKTRQRKVQEEISRLQLEDGELSVALRVFRRFSQNDGEPESKLDPPRPKGTRSQPNELT